jgi:hypothetical protein
MHVAVWDGLPWKQDHSQHRCCAIEVMCERFRGIASGAPAIHLALGSASAKEPFDEAHGSVAPAAGMRSRSGSANMASPRLLPIMRILLRV